MSIKTFSIELISGVPIIRDNDHVILLDTGSPYTIHNSTSFNFLVKLVQAHLILKILAKKWGCKSPLYWEWIF
jgi:hypothetical protein